ncbi:MAG: hypothetical protein AAF620_11285 [Bacteroidota bacterium]
MMNNLKFYKLLTLALGSVFMTACDNDDDDGVGPSSNSEANFAVYSWTSTPSGNVAFVNIAPSLATELNFDADNSLEFEGSFDLFGPDGEGYFIASTGAVLTRYDVAEDGTITQGGSFDLSNTGIAFVSHWNSEFVSPTKAYYLDFNNPIIVEYNPMDMTVTEVINHPASFNIEGYSYSTPFATTIDGDIYTSIDYFSEDFNDRPDGVHIMKIETSTNTLSMISDPRHFVDRQSIHKGPDGFVYIASELDHAFIKSQEGTPEDYILRIDPNTNQFDPNFEVSIIENSGIDRPVYASAMLDNGDVVCYIRSANAPEYTDKWDADRWNAAIASAPDYSEVEIFTDLSLAPPGLKVAEFDGETLIQHYNGDYSELSFYSYDSGRDPELVFEFPEGENPWNFVRLRK